jgi:hypothetical protein
MGKLNFIFKFQEYLQKIEELSINEDIEINDALKDAKLVEGLRMTHPVEKSLNIILRRFPELTGNIEPDGEIFLQGFFDTLKKYNPLFNNLGYHIAKLTIDGEIWIKEFDNNIKPLAILLEAIFDIKIDPIPNPLYHTSSKKFANKISKNGIIPKSGNKLSKHPERIYLTDNLLTAKQFGTYIKETNKEEYNIYEINTKDLDINLYRDINLNNGGYYTLNTISPDRLKIIF